MIRIGIVGCGRILAAHLRGYRVLRELGIDDFQIAALCDLNEDDARGYVKRGEGPPQRPAVSDIPGDPLAIGDEYLDDFQPEVEVEVFTDYEKMIAEGPIDAVNDFTNHGLHHRVAEAAFRNGKHLISQKPLAVSMEAARRMVEGAEKAGVTFGVFENARYRRAVRHCAWAMGQEGPVGPLQMALLGNVGTWWAPDRIVAETPWRHVLAEAGGIALDLGPHFFDVIRHVGGAEIRNVAARTSVVEPVRYLIRDGEKVQPSECDADDTFYASFENDNGATGVMFGSWAGHGTNTILGEGPVFYGAKGRITGDTVHLDGQEPRSLKEMYESDCPLHLQARHFPIETENEFALAQHDWLDAIRNGVQPETCGREGLLDLACSYAVVESAHSGRQVAIDDLVSGAVREYQETIDRRFGLL
jgi:predicted dehydrogenase